mgnify:CR=1 FL=1
MGLRAVSALSGEIEKSGEIQNVQVSGRFHDRTQGGLKHLGAGDADGGLALHGREIGTVIAEGFDFGDGVIELEVAGAPAPGATGGARGFVGVAFRVQPGLRTYDAFYLRPTNGRANGC